MRFRAVMLCAGLAVVAGCSNNPTTPSGSGGNTATSITQVFSGTVAPGDTPAPTFSLPGAQGLHVMFGSLTDGAGFPLGTPLTLQFGVVPDSGTGCNPLKTVVTAPALQAQINVSASAGTYCVALVGTEALTTTANYSIRVIYGTPTETGGGGTIDYPSSVEPGGFTARSFEVGAGGVVTILVDAIAPASVASLNVGVGFQRNDGSGCELSVAAAATRGSQFSIPVDVGRYCVKVTDPGTLTSTTTFTLRIVHP